MSVEYSIVVPVYKCEKCLRKLVDEIKKVTMEKGHTVEIILVDDCGPDQSWKVIRALSEEMNFVKGVRLSRNFGQHLAVTAGLSQVTGEYIVIMDCDLQDDPSYISQFREKCNEGFDIVYGKNAQRKHSAFRNIGARLFSWVFNRLTDGVSSQLNVSGYVMMRKKVVAAYNRVQDCKRHYLLTLQWLGFNSCYIEVEQRERPEGTSSYTLAALINHAFDGITYHSTKLLKLSVLVGFIYLIISMLAGAGLLVRYFAFGLKEGWLSTILVILICTGVILISVGVLGIYIGSIFNQVKGRPLFVISESLNIDEGEC